MSGAGRITSVRGQIRNAAHPVGTKRMILANPKKIVRIFGSGNEALRSRMIAADLYEQQFPFG
jgi:hypothetical protein